MHGQNSNGLCQEGKTGTGKLYINVFMLLRPHQCVHGRWPCSALCITMT